MTFSRAAFALSVIAALGWPCAPARACSGPASWVRIVTSGVRSATPPPAPIPLGAGVLVELVCPYCPEDDETPPEVEVVARDGRELEGTARWVGLGKDDARYALWEPSSPLDAGDYDLSWLAPAPTTANVFDTLSFTVEGAESATQPSALELELIISEVRLGEEFDCPLVDCEGSSPSPITTRRGRLPLLIAHAAPDATVADRAQFLYRALAPDADETAAPAWRTLDEALSIPFELQEDEYCMELQALRVHDDEVLSLGEHCLPDSLGEVEPAWPEPLWHCDAATQEMDAAYLAAWCADNAEGCSGNFFTRPVACVEYGSACGGANDSQGCTALPTSRYSSGLAWLALLALAALFRARSSRARRAG